MEKTLVNILAGAAILSAAACSNPAEPRVLPCDTSCTVALETFNDKELPAVIYSLEMLADTIHLTGDTFHRKYTQIIRWPDVGVFILLGYDYFGKAVRQGNSIELLAEYEIDEQGNKHLPQADHRMHGNYDEKGMELVQDSLYIAKKLVYDGNGVFQYKLVK